MFRSVAILCLSLLCVGCAYDRTKVGKIHGKYSLTWVSSDLFAFIPDANDPFCFERHNGERIYPAAMYTDGGSIPRPLWAFRNYSPWTYGPAYLVHDWLFLAHDCGPDDYQRYTVEEAATVMAEAMKTLMENDKAPKNRLAFEMIYRAVKTDVAEKLWDAPSECDVPAPMATRRFAHGLLRPDQRPREFMPENIEPQRYQVEVDLNSTMPRE